MAENKRSRCRKRPRMALIIESSFTSGRGMFCGIAEYVRQHGQWSIYSEPRGLEEPPPAWLADSPGTASSPGSRTGGLRLPWSRAGFRRWTCWGSRRNRVFPWFTPTTGRLAAWLPSICSSAGLRQFGFCGVRANWSQRACVAFVEALSAVGHPCQVYELPLHGRLRPSWESDQGRLARWIRQLPKPAGIMACSDSRAQRVLEACGRVGVMIPDQVAVIGSGNDETICEFCDPPLSSVVPGYRQVGYEAARMLDRLMRGAIAPSDPLYLKPLGVVTRQSTDVIAVEDPDTAAAVRFIREHACDGVRVQDVAEHCLLSRTELKRRFRRFLGRSVLDQIVRDRVKRAAQLLADTELPIAQIARLSGFSSQQRMGVVFHPSWGSRRRSPQAILNAGRMCLLLPFCATSCLGPPSGGTMRLRATPFVLSSATPRLVLDGRRRHADFGERSPRPKAFHGPKQPKNGPNRRFTLIPHTGRLTQVRQFRETPCCEARTYVAEKWRVYPYTSGYGFQGTRAPSVTPRRTRAGLHDCPRSYDPGALPARCDWPRSAADAAGGPRRRVGPRSSFVPELTRSRLRFCG